MRDLTSRFASLSGQRESQKKGQRLKAEEDRFWAAKKFDRELALTVCLSLSHLSLFPTGFFF